MSTVARLAAAVAASVLSGHAFAFELPKVGLPNMFDGGSKDAPPAPGVTADCPAVSTDNGAAMLRAPADADSANVRYQLSITSAARDCIVEGDRLTIKVGVEGAAMLGPLGAPGSYGANVQVAVRRLKDDSIASSKNYHVTATIPAGGGRADFRLLAEPVNLPVLSPRAQEDYEILVGFTQAGAEKADNSAHKRKKSRRRHGA